MNRRGDADQRILLDWQVGLTISDDFGTVIVRAMSGGVHTCFARARRQMKKFR
jgi:hypothetical protein